jgi:hypothetical protein
VSIDWASKFFFGRRELETDLCLAVESLGRVFLSWEGSRRGGAGGIKSFFLFGEEEWVLFLFLSCSSFPFAGELGLFVPVVSERDLAAASTWVDPEVPGFGRFGASVSLPVGFAVGCGRVDSGVAAFTVGFSEVFGFSEVCVVDG